MSDHAIRWTYEYGGVSGEAICLADPDADCHLTSIACECERWGEIWRRDDGTIWHRIVDGGPIEPQWHEVKVGPDCNVCLFINDSGCVEELTAPGTEFVVAQTPIRPVWQDDGCDWEPVLATDGSED
ncbi:hypothetical protein [Nocardioides soli]|uniref:Uncharacterized protein n=1 Tax=Nocardioides soli TaxID=1036020 RepID=A0A7W4VSJ9_9ACTN|nr:hypothetical protein [Nocardioides soli]MBB3041001.1 hypothetical protein [Nocardioides soli]